MNPLMTRPTPQTDAILERNVGYANYQRDELAEHARTLERERDELVEALLEAAEQMSFKDGSKSGNWARFEAWKERHKDLLAKHSKGAV